MRPKPATDHAIAALATRQGGVVSLAQLIALGLSRESVKRRLRAGRLLVRFRGVYAVGHQRLGVDGRRWAAVLACGDGAVLSHRSAGAAWDIVRSQSGIVDVTVGAGGRTKRDGIRAHRTRSLQADEVTTLGGLPITTPARTLLDLAATNLRDRRLEAALDRAEMLRILDFSELDTLLNRYPKRTGSPSLRAQLQRYHPGTIDTRSELEELTIELCDAHGIERPSVNARIEGRERDFHWPGRALVVEADGYGWHRSPSAMNDDRARDVQLTLAGYRVLRFTYEQVTGRPAYVRDSLLAALSGGEASASRLRRRSRSSSGS